MSCISLAALEGRDEKDCLPSTEKKAVWLTVEVDRCSFLLVDVNHCLLILVNIKHPALFYLVDVDHPDLFYLVDGRHSSTLSTFVDIVNIVDIHFTALFIMPSRTVVPNPSTKFSRKFVPTNNHLKNLHDILVLNFYVKIWTKTRGS